ncbi:sulfotransferase 1B1-like [Littorina saxatilis]|uniref:Sulfotransferase domain-containing protein n=1 Tax=Littorina saxatilis TaxID=31220 RepID=A0AAN9FZC7_9CAEN
MANKMKLELEHSKLKPAIHNGLAMTECYEPLADHLEKVKAMQLRNDDVLLCSFPKSGTHWMYRVIDMLQRGSTQYYDRNADSTFLDAQLIERLSELASPRVLVTHLPFDHLPQQVKDKRTKIVHVYRNPRAVLVSFYHMMKTFKLNTPEYSETTLDKTADLFFSDNMVYYGWFGHLDNMSAYQAQNPSVPIFHISYEEMTLSPVDTVKKLAEFLGKTVTPEFCAQVVEACSFKKQKESEETLDQSQAALTFYRKGDMNDWKNHLTVAHNEKFAKVLKERAEKCPFSAKYT